MRCVVEPPRYELAVAPPARRALAGELSGAVAAAVIEFVTGSLLERRRLVGNPLRGELAGTWSARRGTYRVLYRILEESHEVVVLSVRPRRDGVPVGNSGRGGRGLHF